MKLSLCYSYFLLSFDLNSLLILSLKLDKRDWTPHFTCMVGLLRHEAMTLQTQITAYLYVFQFHFIVMYEGKSLNNRNFILKCMEKYAQRKILFRDTK